MKNLCLRCPACGDSRTKKIGPIRLIAGIIKLKNPGNLYQCLFCNLFFRHPYLESSNLTKQYSELPSDLWGDIENRQDFDMAVSTIRRFVPEGRILDVGCFRGDFLARLPKGYLKYGIEPAESARKIAENQGIKLIANSIETITDTHPKFHVITIFDVIEHVPNPFALLKKLSDLLLPRGIIIVSTGRTDALPWQMMRLDYWYYFSEHISFTDLKWFRWATIEIQLDIIIKKHFSHSKGSPFERWRQFLQCLAFWTLNRIRGYKTLSKFACSIYPFSRAARWPSPPKTNLWPDHLFLVLKSKK